MMRNSRSTVAVAFVVLAACGGGSNGQPPAARSSDGATSTPVSTMDAATSEAAREKNEASATTEVPSETAANSTPVSSSPPITSTTPETTAGSLPAGTRDNPVPLGQGAEVGEGWTAVVNAVTLNANDQVAAANQFNEPPAANNVYVLANVTVTYNGAAASDAAGVQFEALGTASNTVVTSYDHNAVPPDALQSTEVFQGGSLTGNVLFEAPIADIDSLVLIGHALMSFDDADRAFFATR
jgi:hypothetical protein